MSKQLYANQVLDCTGLACPMPIVKTKKAIEAMNPGEVVEMQATDRGSLADIQGWAKNTGHQYLGTLQEGGLLRHFIRKAAAEEEREDVIYPHSITNEDIARKLAAGERLRLIDVREPAEFAFGHIPGAHSIPLGELAGRLGELDADSQIYLICRTGRRSGYACQLLSEQGYRPVNVMPGMSEWTGPTAQS